jgi:hypothetical protein
VPEEPTQTQDQPTSSIRASPPTQQKEQAQEDEEKFDTMSKLKMMAWVKGGDEDITPIQTIHEPTTRAHAQKLNLQVHSSLVNCVLELTLVTMDVLMIRNFVENHQGLGKGQGIEEEQQRHQQQKRDQVRLSCESISGSRITLH